MKTITRNQGRILRKTTAGGLVLLLVLAGLPALAAAEGKVQHWSKVQAVTPGTEIKVELYKDQAPRGSRKIQGRFHSATDDSITLKLKSKEGQRRTLQSSAVRKVLTRPRGYSNRWFPLWPVTERKMKPDWSKVRAVTPGTGIKLGLYKDQAYRGRGKIEGRFHSAAEDSITLTLYKDGQTHTLQSSAVRTVHTRRGEGWFPLGDILWSRVQAVTPGTEIKVELYKDQVPRGSRKIQGHFHSATDDSITLRLKGGQRRTLQKHTVRKVLAYRSFEKRYQGWLAGAAGLAVSGAVMANSVGAEPGQVPMMLVIGTFVPMVIGFLAAPKMGKIYSVPPKHRIKPPGDKQSGSASKASGKQEGPTPKTVE